MTCWGVFSFRFAAMSRAKRTGYFPSLDEEGQGVGRNEACPQQTGMATNVDGRRRGQDGGMGDSLMQSSVNRFRGAMRLSAANSRFFFVHRHGREGGQPRLAKQIRCIGLARGSLARSAVRAATTCWSVFGLKFAIKGRERTAGLLPLPSTGRGHGWGAFEACPQKRGRGDQRGWPPARP
jgi:hypothetical protein